MSTEIQAWLSELIHQRISSQLIVRFYAVTGWHLTVEGSEKLVQLTAAPEAYRSLLRSPLPCASSWDPRAEGWTAPLGLNMPVVGTTETPRQLVSATRNGYRFDFDLFWFALWTFSRAEEVLPTVTDQHGRFPAHACHASQNAYLDRPLVDEWFGVLIQIVQRTWPSLELAKHTFRIQLSHDVDEPRFIEGLSLSAVLRRAVGDILHRGRVQRGLEAPARWLAMKAGFKDVDPYDTFEWVMKEAERRGLRSTFHFLCGQTDIIYDRSYRMDEPYLRDLLVQIQSRGHKIGLHPSYGSYAKPEAIKSECETLRRIGKTLDLSIDPIVARMHYLRWNTPVTPHALAAAGVSADCSLGYAEQVGFRCGTCLGYRAFDPINLKRINLLIQPLVAMDVSFLRNGSYLELDPKAALALLSRMKSVCRAVNGCFTLCWHNSELDSREKRALFEAVLDA